MEPGFLADALTLRREWAVLQEWIRDPTSDWKVLQAARDAQIRTSRMKQAALAAVIGSAIVGPLISFFVPLVVTPIAIAFTAAASRQETFLRPAGQIVEIMDVIEHFARKRVPENGDTAIQKRLENALDVQWYRLGAACRDYKEPPWKRPALPKEILTRPPLLHNPASGRARCRVIPFRNGKSNPRAAG